TVTVTGLVVNATDTDGEVTPGTVNVTVVDDVPLFHSVTDAVVLNQPETSTTGFYQASFGADGLDVLHALLQNNGALGGDAIDLVQTTNDPTNGVTKVVVQQAGSDVFTFYYTATSSAVSQGGDGGVAINAYSNPQNPGSSQFFTLIVNPDGTYDFTIHQNEVLSETTATGDDFGAFGPTGTVATDDGSLVISGTGAINASQNGIGAGGNPSITNGEYINLAFSEEQTGHISFTMQQWTGGTSANVQVYIDGVLFDVKSAPDTIAIASPTKAPITINVEVNVAKAGEVLHSGNTYTLYVADEFQDVKVSHLGGAGFNIDNISYNEVVTVDDLTLNFQLGAADTDGDTSTLGDPLTVTVTNDVVDASPFHLANILSLDDDASLFALAGGEGAETFIISADAIDGSINDIITDFNPVEGDQIDLSELLKGLSSTTDLEAGGYVKIEQSGTDSVVSVDQTGGGDAYQEVAVLQDFSYNSSSNDIVKVLYEDNSGNKNPDNV
ncbi:type I secretion C-terminal target domain-containing protein, partial [Aminobacter sp. DSM 101952]|uniref:type I secretion C-terminal target domain-containing protein n=1 Tax=Aminobacter sp. DSM 101952 TaxID=2735891 RepID=UPI0012E331B8